MKTKIIAGLKKEVLVLELLENGYYEEYRDGIEVRDFLTDEVLTLANYTLLGSPDEIKDEDVKDLVKQSLHTNLFAHYVSGINPPNIYQYKTTLESFNSAIESEIHWVNPFSEVISFLPSNVRYGKTKLVDDWKEAQEKTFDRNRTLIFVKN